MEDYTLYTGNPDGIRISKNENKCIILKDNEIQFIENGKCVLIVDKNYNYYNNIIPITMYIAGISACVYSILK